MMEGVPTFLSANSVCIMRTPNGFVVAPNNGAKPEQCLFFADWASLSAYMAVNFAGTA